MRSRRVTAASFVRRPMDWRSDVHPLYSRCMVLFTRSQRAKAEAVRDLAYGNPFLPARKEAERRALGGAFEPGEPVWSAAVDFEANRPNVERIHSEVESLCAAAQGKIAGAGDGDLALYADVASYALYYRCHAGLLALAETSIEGEPTAVPAGLWRTMRDGYADLLAPRGEPVSPHTPAHLFAILFQTRRAFVQVFDRLIGGSPAAALLRAAVWQSIFTHDRDRHAHHLFDRLRDIATLVTGESGTGKEIVAAAIARSQYRPFDERSRSFAPAGPFAPLNLSALPATLIESELFGHKRGSFTGASTDRRGWLEQAGPFGCVFLDEVGETEPAVQVKLLRVLQERSFTRVGETKPRRFEGKVIAATNRDLPSEMAAGRFRADLYYRLSGDLIRTPPLREQLAGDAGELLRLLRFAARRVVGPDAAIAVADEAAGCVERDLGPHYPWPGNFRELEQCVRNVVVRRCYTPPRAKESDGLSERIDAAKLSAEELLDLYAGRAVAVHGSYSAAARHLGLDRRTVKARAARGAPMPVPVPADAR